MYAKKGLRIIHLWMIFSVLMPSSSLFFVNSINRTLAQQNEEYTYYGVVPEKIFRYNLTDPNDRTSGWVLDTGTVANVSLLVIVAAENGTNIAVYNQSNDKELSKAILGSMEKHFVLLPNGTFFKVVSNKIVSVLLLNYQQIPPAGAAEGPVPYTFYQSTDGLYVGKEFILMASESTGTDYTILALEKSRVTVTRDDGNKQPYSLEANSFIFLMLSPFRVYKFESTGNIMIQSGTVPERGPGAINCFYVPSVDGGYFGKSYYARSTRTWDYIRDYGYRISALEDAKVTVFDLESQKIFADLIIQGGSGYSFMPTAEAIAVISDKPIGFQLIHNGSIEQMAPYAGGTGGIYSGYGIGLTFVGLRPNEDTPFYLPVDAHVDSYFFASEDTLLTIDGFQHQLSADSFHIYNSPGMHTIRSDKNMIIQVNHWPLEPDVQGLQYSGVAIPCVQTIDLVPNVTLTPIGEGFPLTYVVIGAAAVVVVVVVMFVLRKKRG